MRVLILGGGGFIGSAVVDRLLHDGHDIVVLDRKNVKPFREFSAEESVTWIEGDFCDKDDINSALNNIDVVYHLVSTTLPQSSNDNPFFDVESNVLGTIQILNLMAEKKVSRIIFISSGGTVYGNPVYLPIDEQHPTEPMVSYGVTKLAIEKYLAIFERKYGIKAFSMRVSNPYGERQKVNTAQGALTIFSYLALQNKTIEIWGDGSVTRDFLYVADLADAFAKALTYDGLHRVFNISSGTGASLIDIKNTIEKVLGREVSCEYKPGRSFDVPVSILSNSLALKELNWFPAIDLETGVRKTLQWLSDNYLTK
ncbi:NAD-dependent epimerase/dehydratase family protein [Dickeya lacustris]|uniref:NAD-dependent epimerase/dehydratase family protein n=1 Tax=Dickeya lacustris TaxID=2259638 RepID=A0ABY8GB33_9GAMM|nr:NAD-dependent epimerase/dehydratase family protein [Dickeya lacustris]WFN57170.1 NAD-dependent epimerase/dehydratase family protein [Dickeya lacustris]